MRQENNGIRILIVLAIVFAAGIAIIFSRGATEVSAPTREAGTDAAALSEEPPGPVSAMVEDLKQINRDMKAITESAAERDRENEMLRTRVDELTQQIAELTAQDEPLESRRQAEVGARTAKVANFDDGTVFYAPTCGTGAGDGVFAFIPKSEVRTGYNRPCIPLARRTFSIGVGEGSETPGTMTAPVTKRIPNAIAPYRPRADMHRARHGR